VKSLIERLRGRPEWQSPDPSVRAEAVLKLPSTEREALTTLARTDSDARVRRAAVKKLGVVPLLAEIARNDADPGVREEATAHLTAVALHEQNPDLGQAAVLAIDTPRQLAVVAKGAPIAATRIAAVARLTDPKALAAVVREAEDPSVRMEALGRIEDGATLTALALKSEHKAVALAAVERVSQAEDLRSIAAKARVGGAARRAAARLLTMAETPASGAPASPESDLEAERRAYEEGRAALEREAAEKAEAAARRDALIERVLTTAGADVPTMLDEVLPAWGALGAPPAAEAEALTRRFDEAVLDARARHQAALGGELQREAFDTLAVEAQPLAEAEDVVEAQKAFRGLLQRWQELSAAGTAPPDVAARFEAVRERLRSKDAAARDERARRDRENLSRLVALCERAEALARREEPLLRDADRTLRELREAQDAAGRLSSRTDRETLLARLEAARKQLFPRVVQLREDAEWKRWLNVDVQEELCRRAEALIERTDYEKVAGELKDLEFRWKQAKEAPKEQGEPAWTRFKAARDAARARCEEFFRSEAEAQQENLKKKRALCESAEALAESTDWVRTADELKRLQNEWKAVGPAPQAMAKALWDRFRRPCDHFFKRRDEHFSARKEEWTSNLARKEALCARAEALSESTDWEIAAAEIRRLQGEWKGIGAVRKNQSDLIWQRFRRACDSFFERYKHRDSLALESAVAAREALCAQMEGRLPRSVAEPGPAAEGLAESVLAAQAAWKAAPVVTLRDQADLLAARFAGALGRILEAWPTAFAGTDLDPEVNRKKMERLLAKVESALAEAEARPGASSEEGLAERLKNALAANTIGGKAGIEERWRSAAAEVDTALEAWQKIGPVPDQVGRDLGARFEAATRKILARRPADPVVREERPRTRSGPGRRSRPQDRPARY
jgi:hypothetical protein